MEDQTAEYWTSVDIKEFQDEGQKYVLSYFIFYLSITVSFRKTNILFFTGKLIIFTFQVAWLLIHFILDFFQASEEIAYKQHFYVTTGRLKTGID